MNWTCQVEAEEGGGEGCTTQGFGGGCLPGYDEVNGWCCPSGGSANPGCSPGTWGYTHYDWECYNGVYSGCSCIVYTESPVLIDVLGDGFRLTDPAGGVMFDLTGDGSAERVAWTATSSDDAWLALDRNGNAVVDDGRELFGNNTPQPQSPAPNGFLALAEYDKAGKGGNADGVIDSRDAVFSHLRLWRDGNHDGVSQPAELQALPALDVARLYLSYKESNRVDEHGNRFAYRAKVDDAKGAKVTRWAWDVFLKVAP